MLSRFPPHNGESGRCLCRSSDAMGCLCCGPPGWGNRKLPDRTSVVVGGEFLSPLLWPFLRHLTHHTGKGKWQFTSLSVSHLTAVYWGNAFMLQSPTLSQTGSILFTCPPAAEVCCLILTRYHAWLSSTCLLQGVRGAVLVGPQFKLGVYLVLRVSRAFWGLQELRVPQDQEETEGYLERQAREESRCVPRDEPWALPPYLDWLPELNDFITDLQGFSGFPGVKGFKGQKGDFIVIDIKGEFYN